MKQETINFINIMWLFLLSIILFIHIVDNNNFKDFVYEYAHSNNEINKDQTELIMAVSDINDAQTDLILTISKKIRGVKQNE